MKSLVTIIFLNQKGAKVDSRINKIHKLLALISTVELLLSQFIDFPSMGNPRMCLLCPLDIAASKENFCSVTQSKAVRKMLAI